MIYYLDIEDIKSICIEFVSNCFILKEVNSCYHKLSPKAVLIDEENSKKIYNSEVIIDYILNDKKYISYQILDINAYKTDQNQGIFCTILYLKNKYKIPITLMCNSYDGKIEIAKIYIEKAKNITNSSSKSNLNDEDLEILEINKEMDIEREKLINYIDGGYCSLQIKNSKIIPISFSYKLPNFFGYSRKEFANIFYNDIFEFFTENKRKIVLEEIEKAIDLDRPYSTTFEVINKDKSVKAYLFKLKKTYDSKANPILTLFVLGENYEVKLNKDILNYMSSAIVVIQKDNNLIYKNDMANTFLEKYNKLNTLPNSLNNLNLEDNKKDKEENVYEIKCDVGIYFEIKEKEIEWLGKKVLIRIINDISSKKRISKTLVENTKKLDLAIKSLNAFYWTYLVDRDSLLVDNKYKENIGFETNFIINFKLHVSNFNIIHPSDLDLFFDEIDNCIECASSDNFCVRLKLKRNEDYRWCKLKNSLINGKKESKKILITIQDVSEDMTSMKKYINLSEQFEYEASGTLVSFIINLSQNKIDKIISTREDTDYTIYKTANSLYQFSKDCRIGDYNKKFDDDYFDTNNLIKYYHNGKTSFEYIVCYSFNAHNLWVKKTISLVKNPVNDEIIAFHAIKDATNEIQTNQILDYIVEKHFDFIVRVNLTSKICNLVINPKFAPKKNKTRYICTIKEFINLIYRRGDLYVPSEEEYIEQITKCMRDNYFFEDYIEYSENDNYIRKKINIYKIEETEDTVIVACSDITALTIADNKKAKTLSKALERANQANKAKTTFLSAMSHDIRTPINAITGMTDLALKDLKNEKQLVESFKIIKNSSNHLLSLINEILEMSAIESGKHIVRNEPIDLLIVINKVTDRLYSIAHKKKINLIFENNNINPKILGDELAISRIVENITNNAIKFTPEGGYIKIYVDDKIKDIYNNNLIRITISDSGFGIDDENLLKIFDSFYRTGNAAKGGVEGTGLGLSITKGLVDSLNGVIKVDSKKNRGTTFIIDIPLNRVNKSEVGKKKSSLNVDTNVLTNLNILLFEDHPINALVAKKLISSLGANVVCAKDGKEGIEIFEKSSQDYFDIIFMDVQMPNIDGFEATKIIRKLDRSDATSVPIIAMTANVFAQDIEKCLAVGMNSHISKPIETKVIIKEIKKMLK